MVADLQLIWLEYGKGGVLRKTWPGAIIP